MKKFKEKRTEEARERQEEDNKDLKAEWLSTNTRKNTLQREPMKPQSERKEPPKKTDTQAMMNIDLGSNQIITINFNLLAFDIFSIRVYI